LNKTGKPGHRQPKAYQDIRFLTSKDARALRILAEYMEPLYRFQRHNIQDTIVFMGSARFTRRQRRRRRWPRRSGRERVSRLPRRPSGSRSITRRRESSPTG